jgi:anti-anti-sigma regulatory factor/CHASE1-domain containing sensor protein
MNSIREDNGTPSETSGRLPVVLTLVVGVFLSLATFYAARQQEWQSIEQDFRRVAADRQTMVQNAVKSLMSGTRGIRGYYTGLGRMTQKDFSDFTYHPEETAAPTNNGGDVLWYTGMRAIAWAPLVREADRDRFEREQVKADGHPGFRIDTGGRPIAYNQLFPICFVEPPDYEGFSRGYEIYSDLHYYDVLRQAIGETQTFITGRKQIGRDRYVVELVTPVFQREEGFRSSLKSTREPAGVSISVVDMTELMEFTLMGSDTSDPGIHTWVLDMAATEDESELFHRQARDDDGVVLDVENDLILKTDFLAGLRMWQVADAASPMFVSSRRTFQPWMLGGVLLVGTFILVGFLNSTTEKNRQVAELAGELQKSHGALEIRVEERTAALATATDELQQSHDQMEIRVQEATSELQDSHDKMEQRVEERTADLARASDEIMKQNEAIMDMSTPVIQLWQGIVLMPLIGMLDTTRATQMSDRALEAIVESQSKVLIIDVTGVPVIDTSVARHILTVVDASRILGAEVIITGFSPEAAQTLAQLRVDFKTLQTRGSLRAGIAVALRMVGMEVSDRSARRA